MRSDEAVLQVRAQVVAMESPGGFAAFVGTACQERRVSPPEARRRQRSGNGGKRLCEIRCLNWHGRRIQISVGYDDSGRRPLQIACKSGWLPGSTEEGVVSDLCIMLSEQLPDEDVTALHSRRSASAEQSAGPSDDGGPATVLGALLREIMRGTDRPMSEAFNETGKSEPATVLGLLLREIMRPPSWLPRDKAQWPRATILIPRDHGARGCPDKSPGAEEHADESRPGMTDRAASAAPDATGSPGPVTGNENRDRRGR